MMPTATSRSAVRGDCAAVQCLGLRQHDPLRRLPTRRQHGAVPDGRAVGPLGPGPLHQPRPGRLRRLPANLYLHGNDNPLMRHRPQRDARAYRTSVLTPPYPVQVFGDAVFSTQVVAAGSQLFADPSFAMSYAWSASIPRLAADAHDLQPREPYTGRRSITWTPMARRGCPCTAPMNRTRGRSSTCWTAK